MVNEAKTPNSKFGCLTSPPCQHVSVGNLKLAKEGGREIEREYKKTSIRHLKLITETLISPPCPGSYE